MFIKVYHVSPIKNRTSILEHGLIPKARHGMYVSYSPSIFVSTIPNDLIARDYTSHSYIDIWRFIVLKKHLKKDIRSGFPFHYYIQHHIPKNGLMLFNTVL